MVLFRLSERLKRLALCLSALALCSALMAPALALAQEGGSGKWSGLCAASGAPESGGHALSDDDHCGLCLLPSLLLVGADRTSPPPSAAAASPEGQMRSVVGAPQGAPPSIRGPPILL